MAGCQSRYKQEKGSNEQAKIIKQSITNKKCKYRRKLS